MTPRMSAIFILFMLNGKVESKNTETSPNELVIVQNDITVNANTYGKQMYKYNSS